MLLSQGCIWAPYPQLRPSRCFALKGEGVSEMCCFNLKPDKSGISAGTGDARNFVDSHLL